MAKSLLGNDESKEGFIITTSYNGVETKKQQDSPKEDYIFCESCEKYFEIIETYISTRLTNRLWDIRKKEQFTTFDSEKGARYKRCDQIESCIFKLFIYSILWRCSIAFTIFYKNFRLRPQEEEILREIIQTYKCKTQTELLNKTQNIECAFKDFPFLLFTCEHFEDYTKNPLFLNHFQKDPYHIIINKFILLFSFEVNGEMSSIQNLNYSQSSKIKIGILTPEKWSEHLNLLINLIKEIQIGNNNVSPNFYKQLLRGFENNQKWEKSIF